MAIATPPRRRQHLDRRALARGLVAAGAGVALPWPRTRAQDKDPLLASGIAAVEVKADPIAAFAREQPDVRRFGRLEFLGGLVLSSPAVEFGGWSGLVVDADGKRLLAISDAGSWMAADLTAEGARPAGLANVRLGPILDLQGRPFPRKADADAEAIALIEGSLEQGMLLVGFERNHRIARYPVRAGIMGRPAGMVELPAEARRMTSNQGLEALAVLKGGRYSGAVVAFAERYVRESGYHTGWIWADGGEPRPLLLQDIAGFNITDAAGLPDGSLLVLERYFRWSEGVKMRLRLLPAGEIAPGARITGQILFEGGNAYEIDNMECLAVHPGADGTTILTLLSDDNFNRALQQTLLLQFRLRAAHAAGPEMRG